MHHLPFRCRAVGSGDIERELQSLRLARLASVARIIHGPFSVNFNTSGWLLFCPLLFHGLHRLRDAVLLEGLLCRLARPDSNLEGRVVRLLERDIDEQIQKRDLRGGAPRPSVQGASLRIGPHNEVLRLRHNLV